MTRSRVSKVTFKDVVLIADRCFGPLGRKTIFLWRQYNGDYFGGRLKPTPVLYVRTSPYGHWVGCFLRDKNIYLMYPGETRSWGFVRGVLLHEMVHQHLAQVGKNRSHDNEPWCAEIMRISRMLGRNIWAGKHTVIKVDGRSVRANKRPPADFDARALALNQDEISRWPQSIGIDPPNLRA